MGKFDNVDNMELDDLRIEIDDLDSKMIEILRARLAIAEEVARVKSAHRMNIEDSSRERDVVHGIRALAEKKGVNPDFAERLMELIMSESKRVQKECMR